MMNNLTMNKENKIKKQIKYNLKEINNVKIIIMNIMMDRNNLSINKI